MSEGSDRKKGMVVVERDAGSLERMWRLRPTVAHMIDRYPTNVLTVGTYEGRPLWSNGFMALFEDHPAFDEWGGERHDRGEMDRGFIGWYFMDNAPEVDPLKYLVAGGKEWLVAKIVSEEKTRHILLDARMAVFIMKRCWDRAQYPAYKQWFGDPVFFEKPPSYIQTLRYCKQAEGGIEEGIMALQVTVRPPRPGIMDHEHEGEWLLLWDDGEGVFYVPGE